jgi:putative ABC transport system permease protein
VPFEPNGRTAEIAAADAVEPGRRMPFLMVDYDFFETYRIELRAGRTFSAALGDRPAVDAAPGTRDGVPFVISELAARELGWTPEQALGRWLEFTAVQGSRFRADEARGPVVGIVDDVYFQSIHNALEPMIYLIPYGSGSASLRLTGRDVESALAHIETVWRRFRPDLPATRRFLDETFESLYRAEERQGRLIAMFAALATTIACLGVFGLVSFATQRRTKEIGIRKVMGGTPLDIVGLFAGEFGRLLLVANVLAWPAGYAIMQRWLEPFAYRIDLGVPLFVGAGLLVIAVAMATVAAVAGRAAAAKPIHSLRYE